MTKDKRYKFYVVLGDWSQDGHGKSEKVLIKSNLPVGDTQKAYKKSVEDTGFHFAEEICSDYNVVRNVLPLQIVGGWLCG